MPLRNFQINMQICSIYSSQVGHFSPSLPLYPSIPIFTIAKSRSCLTRHDRYVTMIRDYTIAIIDAFPFFSFKYYVCVISCYRNFMPHEYTHIHSVSLFLFCWFLFLCWLFVSIGFLDFVLPFGV